MGRLVGGREWRPEGSERETDRQTRNSGSQNGERGQTAMKKLRGGAEEDCSDENGGSGGGERGGEREPRAPTEGLGGSWATRGGGEGSKIPWVGGRGAGGTGHLPPPSRGPERRRGAGANAGRPQPRCPRRPRTPTRRSRSGARSPGAALRGPDPLPHPGRLPGWQRDDVTRRGRRVATATRRRRYGDAATHAPAVAAGAASRATMREGAPSPRQRGPHARPEARAGLEGPRGAEKSGGVLEISKQFSRTVAAIKQIRFAIATSGLLQAGEHSENSATSLSPVARR